MPGRGWIDGPDVPRFHLVFPDVEEFRKLVAYLPDSNELVLSAYRLNGAPRWECRVSAQPTPAMLKTWTEPDVRLQASVFIPLPQLPLLLDALSGDSPGLPWSPLPANDS